MAIKRKTHLNLSGSHHTLDSDNAFVGGFLYTTGSISASLGVSASAGFQAGDASTFKAATFGGYVSASNYIATANNLQVGQNAYVTGSVQVTGSVFAQNTVSASQGIFTQLTGSLSGTTAGLPFLVNGGNMAGVNYNDATGQWEITGSTGTSVAGANAQIQFNADGVHGASSDLVFYSASFGQYPAGTIVVPTASIGTALFVGGINSTPITRNASTSDGNGFNVPSSNFLTFTNLFGQTLGNYSIAAFDFTIVAVAQNSDNYATWNFTATGIKDSAGATKLIDYLEVSQGSSGALGDTWSVNVYDDLSVGLTGSAATTVQWWMKASMKAALSGSGNTRY
jgi:hypothetical protein